MAGLLQGHIAAVTGWGQDEDRRKARDAGFDSNFTKPLGPAVMEEFLNRIAQGIASDGNEKGRWSPRV